MSYLKFSSCPPQGRRPGTRHLLRPGLLLAASLCLGLASSAATFHVSPSGDDTNAGTAEAPWQSLRRSIQGVQAGDTLLLGPGRYDEYPATVRGGSNEAARIVFRSNGDAVIRGWQVNHPYITLENLQFSGLSSQTVLDAYIRVGGNGDLLQVLGCTVRDGIKAIRQDMRFEAETSRILSDTGGFLEAGFAPGQFLIARPTERGVSLPPRNTLILRVDDVSDDAITVTNRLDDAGPMPIYLTGSPQHGMYLDNGSRGVIVKGCTFRNLSYQSWFIFGTGHTIEDNVIEQANGWDAMHFGGFNHLFRRNVIRDSPMLVFQISPDAMENYSPIPYSRVVFKQNFVTGFEGLIASQKGGGTSVDLAFLRNVFHQTGWFYGTHPRTRFENNTFVRCSTTSGPAFGSANHPLTFVMPAPGASSPANARDSLVLNNAFIECGEATGTTDPATIGWYAIDGPNPTLVAGGNFVAGPSPDFPPRSAWPEAPSLNGGNPLFSDPLSPLGPDGLPFTQDDGFRPTPESPLVGTGLEGRSVGAYEIRASQQPTLNISRGEGISELILTWPADIQDWTLEAALAPEGPWYGVPSWPVPVDGVVSAVVNASEVRMFYRLVL